MAPDKTSALQVDLELHCPHNTKNMCMPYQHCFVLSHYICRPAQSGQEQHNLLIRPVTPEALYISVHLQELQDSSDGTEQKNMASTPHRRCDS